MINGFEGYYQFGAIGKKISKGLSMKELGESVGICIHYQTADDIAGDFADEEIAKNPKKKRDQLI